MPHGPTLQQKRQQSSLARQVLIFTATVPNCSNLIHRQTGSDDPPYTYRTLKLFHAIHCSAQYHWIAWYNSTIFYHLYTSRAIWWTLRISAELIIIQQRTFIWAPIEMCIPFNIKDFIQKTRLLKTKSTVFSGHQVSDCHGLYFIKFWDFRFNWVLVFNCFYRFLGFPEGVVVKVLAGWVCGQWLGMAGLQSKRH